MNRSRKINKIVDWITTKASNSALSTLSNIIDEPNGMERIMKKYLLGGQPAPTKPDRTLNLASRIKAIHPKAQIEVIITEGKEKITVTIF